MADMYLGNESGGFDLVGTTNIKNIDFEEVKISKEDYENLSEEERKTGIHLVTGLDDTENGGGSADLISYDNTNSGLGSTNVQGAIDELNSNLETLIKGDDEYVELAFTNSTNTSNQVEADLTKYKGVIIAVAQTNDKRYIINPVYFPMNLFKTTQRLYTAYNNGAYFWGTAGYVNDNTIIVCVSSAGPSVFVYGVN